MNDRAKLRLLYLEKEFKKHKIKYEQSLEEYLEAFWENEINKGGVTVIEEYEYARPWVTFNGKWEKERYISTKKPIETKFAEVDGEIYYPNIYYSGDNYKYELNTRNEYFSRKKTRLIA